MHSGTVEAHQNSQIHAKPVRVKLATISTEIVPRNFLNFGNNRFCQVTNRRLRFTSMSRIQLGWIIILKDPFELRLTGIGFLGFSLKNATKIGLKITASRIYVEPAYNTDPALCQAGIFRHQRIRFVPLDRDQMNWFLVTRLSDIRSQKINLILSLLLRLWPVHIEITIFTNDFLGVLRPATNVQNRKS